MFLCSKRSKINKLEGKECTISKADFRPDRHNTTLLTLYPFGIDEVEVKVPHPQMYLWELARDTPSPVAVFVNITDCEIWCDEAQRYFTFDEIHDRGYFVYDNKILLIGLYNYAEFDDWLAVEGEFEFEVTARENAKMRIRTK